MDPITYRQPKYRDKISCDFDLINVSYKQQIFLSVFCSMLAKVTEECPGTPWPILVQQRMDVFIKKEARAHIFVKYLFLLALVINT